ncbi:HNH endonuclease [Microbispora bryophytorum]|uniref:DUF222 domain-containing protein n=1 Tax=Microbispora bryophytorum TaxID=1460882 RepID=A0A8H9GT84_9ACTN|nr:HNH endonuclease [Microbispora bryophytorum]MBD3135342.1 DUF222 domain-containing protein [Microbispora bryophytorum]TQS09545.1 DUF222 domain-containing protein [Microbispora bryophytorum]GGN97114.1 hypothetical protein GCM10011574_00400 [Microbispora bryophytorum]
MGPADFDPDHLRRLNNSDSSGSSLDGSSGSGGSAGWWDRLTSGSRWWSADGSAAREHFPIADPQPAQHASRTKADSSTKSTGSSTGSGLTDSEPTSGDASGAASADSAGGVGAGAGSARGAGARDAATGAARGRSSWVLVGSLRESAQALALAALPGDADICVAEAEDLLFARDRITCALADRVGRVHGAGQARQHGHASTRSWLRTAAGMSVAGAGRLLTLAVELARLPRVREKFAAGVLSAGVVEAICTATARLSDEHAGLAEPILLELAGKAGPAEVAKAGRYLRAVLDPDGEERDERADYGRRFLRIRPTAGGGLEGEFYLPREAAARLRALLDAYAKPRAEGDDRPLRVRQADAFIALMEQKIVAELLVLVNAESLPTDPQPDHPEAAQDAQSAEDTQDVQGATSAEDGRDSGDTGAFGDTGSVAGPCPVGDDDIEDAIPSDDDPGNLSDVDFADAVDVGMTDAASARGEGPYRPRDPGTAEAETAAAPTADAETAADAGAVAEAAAGSTELDLAGTGPRDEESHDPEANEHRPCEGGTDERGTCERDAGGCGGCEQRASDHDTANAAPAEGSGAGDGDVSMASAAGDVTAPRRGADRDHAAAQAETDPERAAARPAYSGSTPPHAAPPHAVRPRAAHSRAAEWPDPPPEDAAAHTHFGHQPAGDCRHAQGTPEGRNDVHHEQPSAGTARSAAPGAPRPEPGTPPGRPSEPEPGTPSSEPAPGTPPGKPLGAAPGRPPGRPTGTASRTLPGTAPGEPGLGAVPGALLGAAPGLLLATGQMLPVSSVHRLARTSALVRLVMDAEGQVLDMGRKVRLATPAQRRAVYARYATCWIDGCPLPATMGQIDHADNWSTGGLTDLKLLGPACQFHNRDRYQHPDRYTRHQTGTDRWTFTYRLPPRARP